MSSLSWVAGLCTGLAVWLASPVPPRGSAPTWGHGPIEPAASRVEQPADPRGPLLRWRSVWTLGAGIAGLVWFPGWAGILAGAASAATTWVTIGRATPPGVLRERESAAHDLPHVVSLLAATLRSGASPVMGLRLVCEALPGSATARLTGLIARVELGADPGEVWRLLSGDDVLAPLGRALARAHDSGASVVLAIDRLAGDLARDHRGVAEDRARAVGVKAAIPLGLCLLPSFLLVGIVPVVAGLLTGFLS